MESPSTAPARRVNFLRGNRRPMPFFGFVNNAVEDSSDDSSVDESFVDTDLDEDEVYQAIPSIRQNKKMVGEDAKMKGFTASSQLDFENESQSTCKTPRSAKIVKLIPSDIVKALEPLALEVLSSESGVSDFWLDDNLLDVKKKKTLDEQLKKIFCVRPRHR